MRRERRSYIIGLAIVLAMVAAIVLFGIGNYSLGHDVGKRDGRRAAEVRYRPVRAEVVRLRATARRLAAENRHLADEVVRADDVMEQARHALDRCDAALSP